MEDEPAPVVIVKQEPVEDNSEPLERVNSTNADFDPLDVKDELLDPEDINKKSFGHPEKPGPAPKNNEPTKLYHEVYIKTEPNEECVYEVPSNSDDEDEIPNFDGAFSDDELPEENSHNNAIGNVASIKEEPLDHLAN